MAQKAKEFRDKKKKKERKNYYFGELRLNEYHKFI